jgi:hypothetical protein
MVRRGAYDFESFQPREDERYIGKVGGGRNMEAGKGDDLPRPADCRNPPPTARLADLACFWRALSLKIVPRAANWGLCSPGSPPLAQLARNDSLVAGDPSGLSQPARSPVLVEVEADRGRGFALSSKILLKLSLD